MKYRVALPLTLLALTLAGCSGAYYGAMEKIGIAKRDILVDRVSEARKSQEAAKDQFQSALDHFIAVTNVQPGDLKGRYDDLNREYNRSQERATDVRNRIAAVSDVADALFSEWKKELHEYSDQNLRRESEREYDQTRRRYEDLMNVMRTAASRMDPILAKFHDQVLFVKHNLNAQAIAGLSATSEGLQKDITRLIDDMEKSIREADGFIRTMKDGKG